jgi:serralysin
MPPPNIDTNDVVAVMADGWWVGGSSLVLTYSMNGGAWTGYGGSGEPTDSGYGLLSAAQQTMFEQAMETWDSYVAAEFNKATSGVGAIRVAFTGIDDSNVWGYAYLPPINNSPATKNRPGDIWIDEDLKGSDFAVGSYDYVALLHEIGHTLGLDHTFYESPGSTMDQLPAQFDNARYSIMSYTEIADYWHVFFTSGGVQSNFAGVNPITPMMFDILVVQDRYGASTTTRAGATTYQFDPNAACLQTIFDSSGADTWDLGGHVRRSVIDLRPGSFSSVDMFAVAAQIEYWVDAFGEGFRSFITDQFDEVSGAAFTWQSNVAVAYGTIIEHVICGNASDSVVGNMAANTLQGNRGADKLNGVAGNDTLIGGLGLDVLIGGPGADKFVFNAPAVAAHRDTIKDFVSGVDKIHLENSVFAKLVTPGNLAAENFWVGASAHDGADYIIYDNATGALFYDADANGAGAQVQIATLAGAPSISLSDFLIV